MDADSDSDSDSDSIAPLPALLKRGSPTDSEDSDDDATQPPIARRKARVQSTPEPPWLKVPTQTGRRRATKPSNPPQPASLDDVETACAADALVRRLDKIRNGKETAPKETWTGPTGGKFEWSTEAWNDFVNGKFHGLMIPRGFTLAHPAAPLLMEYATAGCPANVGPDWTKERIAEAVRQGPHPSARDPDAVTQLRAETLEKVEQGYARTVRWNEIKDDPPPNLKISPVAMIPHKSRQFRCILDL